jgi:hypothetical protein
MKVSILNFATIGLKVVHPIDVVLVGKGDPTRVVDVARAAMHR